MAEESSSSERSSAVAMARDIDWEDKYSDDDGDGGGDRVGGRDAVDIGIADAPDADYDAAAVGSLGATGPVTRIDSSRTSSTFPLEVTAEDAGDAVPVAVGGGSKGKGFGDSERDGDGEGGREDEEEKDDQEKEEVEEEEDPEISRARAMALAIASNPNLTPDEVKKLLVFPTARSEQQHRNGGGGLGASLAGLGSGLLKGTLDVEEALQKSGIHLPPALQKHVDKLAHQGRQQQERLEREKQEKDRQKQQEKQEGIPGAQMGVMRGFQWKGFGGGGGGGSNNSPHSQEFATAVNSNLAGGPAVPPPSLTIPTVAPTTATGLTTLSRPPQGVNALISPRRTRAEAASSLSPSSSMLKSSASSSAKVIEAKARAGATPSSIPLVIPLSPPDLERDKADIGINPVLKGKKNAAVAKATEAFGQEEGGEAQVVQPEPRPEPEPNSLTVSSTAHPKGGGKRLTIPVVDRSRIVGIGTTPDVVNPASSSPAVEGAGVGAIVASVTGKILGQAQAHAQQQGKPAEGCRGPDPADDEMRQQKGEEQQQPKPRPLPMLEAMAWKRRSGLGGKLAVGRNAWERRRIELRGTRLSYFKAQEVPQGQQVQESLRQRHSESVERAIEGDAEGGGNGVKGQGEGGEGIKDGIAGAGEETKGEVDAAGSEGEGDGDGRSAGAGGPRPNWWEQSLMNLAKAQENLTNLTAAAQTAAAGFDPKDPMAALTGGGEAMPMASPEGRWM